MLIENYRHSIFAIILILVAVTLNMPMLFNNIAIALLLIFFFVNIKTLKKEGTLWLYLLPIIIVALDLLSVFNSTNVKDALSILEKRSTLLIFPIVFLFLPKVNQKTLHLVFKYFIYTLTVVCAIALSLALYENYKRYGFSFNYQSVWIMGHHKLSNHVEFHATYLSNYILFALSILAFYKHKEFSINKKLKLIIIVLLLTCFFLLSVRTTFVTFVFLVFYYVFDLFKANKRKLIIGFFITTLIIAFAFFNNTMLKERVYDVFSIGKSEKKSRFGGSSIRMYNWGSAYKIFKEKPVFGVGNGDVEDELNKKYALLKQNKYDLKDYNSHSQYLNAMAAKGVIGLLSILAFIFLGMIYAYKVNNKLLLILLIINAISFVTENVLTRNKGILFLFYFYCLLISNQDFNLKAKNEQE